VTLLGKRGRRKATGRIRGEKVIYYPITRPQICSSLSVSRKKENGEGARDAGRYIGEKLLHSSSPPMPLVKRGRGPGQRSSAGSARVLRKGGAGKKKKPKPKKSPPGEGAV